MQRWFKDNRGATSIEYALIAAIVSISIVAGAGLVGRNLNVMFTSVSNGFSTR